MSDFDPTLDGGEPLDLSSMMPVQAQAPQTRPQLPQPAKQPSGFAQAALAALLPLAAKRGGRPAIAALMQGLQQAQAQAQQTHNTSEQQRFQNERLMAGDERAQMQQMAQQQHQQAVQGNQQRTAQANLLKDYAAKVSVAESAEQIAALKETFGYAAQVLGIPASTVDAIASKAAPTSSALIERQVTKVVKGLSPAQLDHFAQNEMAIQVPGQGLPIPYAEWSKYLTAGIGKDGKPVISVQKPNAVNPGSFEEYVNLPPEMQALREQQRKKFNQSDDHPRITVNTGGLPPATTRRVDTKARAFESLPIVKTVQKQAEAASFAESLNPNTTNPADDQALIYAFAKAMDPDSVVREGEYATVQKYAQSWAESFSFNAARIFSNTAFLTPQARANMKKTIRARYQAGRNQYDNVRRSYVQQINKITQQGDGDDYLTDFGAGFPQEATGSAARDKYRQREGAK